MFQFILRNAIAIAILTLALSVQTRADWINLTSAETAPNIAEIYVLDDRVRLVLEAHVGDLDVFDELVPDDWLADKIDARPPLDERIRAFAERKFQMGRRPSALTLIPPLDEEGRARVSVGFVAYHKSVPMIDFRYLGAPARVAFDWGDPWYSRFDNPNLKRHHKVALMSNLYVEPYEVRHEVLTRVKDIANWMDLGPRGDEFIEIDELQPLKQRIGEFLLGCIPVLAYNRRSPGSAGEAVEV